MGLTKGKMIEIPRSVFESAQTKEELVDWLSAQDPDFNRRMRKARADDLAGKGTDWVALKGRLLMSIS